jgi:hypothetical protein
VSRDEVRDQILLLARLFGVLFEELLEAIVGADSRLHHFGEGRLGDVFGGDLQVATHMMSDELFYVLGRFDCEIITQT